MEGRVILIPSVRKCLLTLTLTDVSSWILGAGLLCLSSFALTVPQRTPG